jgi:undecaprenyl diphosphate synthase
MSVPRHVAVIMDGNGRWAHARGLERLHGHRHGIEPVRMIIEQCTRQHIEALTLFAFSSENWQRPGAEVASLMGLFLDALASEIGELQKNGVRLCFIGDLQPLEPVLRGRMSEAEAATAGNAGLKLQIAVSYGGRSDIVRAARQLAAACERGELHSHDIDEPGFADHLALKGLPDPDLFIRTGGEQRISNFLLWNLAYTELYFTPTLWPDFDAQAFAGALQHFASRQRRFGLTAAQLAPGEQS